MTLHHTSGLKSVQSHQWMQRSNAFWRYSNVFIVDVEHEQLTGILNSFYLSRKEFYISGKKTKESFNLSRTSEASPATIITNVWRLWALGTWFYKKVPYQIIFTRKTFHTFDSTLWNHGLLKIFHNFSKHHQIIKLSLKLWNKGNISCKWINFSSAL